LFTRKTALGCQVFRCSPCQRIFNERTGPTFNYLKCPTDLVRRVVLGWLRDKLSPHDLAPMFLVRGFGFTHEAGRDREAVSLHSSLSNDAPGASHHD
jgi:hypothetical protein